MEHFEYQANESDGSNFGIDETAKGYLLETARWGKFLAIVGFVAIGILAIAGLLFSTVFSRLGDTIGSGMPGAMMFVVYLLIAVLYFFPTYYLFRFSKGIKPAMINADQGLLNEALSYLRKAFRYMGVLTIVIIGLYALAFIIAISTAAFY